MLASTIRCKFRKIVCGGGLLVVAVLSLALAIVLPARGQDRDQSFQSDAGEISSSGFQSDVQMCVTRAMLRATILGDHSIQVSPANLTNPSGAAEGEQGVGVPHAPQTPKELQNMYELFARAARRGDPAAQVNLAIVSLAGWGTRENAGAALYWLNEAARRGYRLAYFDLGMLYQNGCGVRQDYREAARYFRLGGEAKHAASQMNLGYLYDQGLGVVRDRAQAAAWYRRAAEQGLAQAQFNLGDLYAQGEGIERNESEALEWFRKAAVQGHTTAQLMLAAMYTQGWGTPRDLPMAYGWLTAARLAGDVRAEVRLRSIEPHLSTAEIAEARARAVRLVRQASPKATVAVLR